MREFKVVVLGSGGVGEYRWLNLHNYVRIRERETGLFISW